MFNNLTIICLLFFIWTLFWLWLFRNGFSLSVWVFWVWYLSKPLFFIELFVFCGFPEVWIIRNLIGHANTPIVLQKASENQKTKKNKWTTMFFTTTIPKIQRNSMKTNVFENCLHRWPLVQCISEYSEIQKNSKN